MNCTRCQNKFDQFKYVPKLLINCGHSLCEKCCNQLFKIGKIQCIQCKIFTFTDNVMSLPKNLALIGQRQDKEKFCEKHEKKYEAFCSKQRKLICIQCILQDGHKNHQMNSIQRAYEAELSKYRTKTQKIQQYLKSIQQKSNQNIENQNLFLQSYKEFIQNTQSIFNSIKIIINQQQEHIFKEVSQLYETQILRINDKKKLYEDVLARLTTTIFNSQELQKLSDIEFLDQINFLEEHLNSIKFISHQNTKNPVFPFTKQVILESSIKALTNEKNPPLKYPAYNSNSSNTNVPPKNQKNFFVQPVRGIRKAAFSNILNNQNVNKSQKKISTRKQSITHHVQTPAFKIVDKDKALKPSNNIRPVSSCGNSGQKKNTKKIYTNDCSNFDISSVDHRQSLCNSFLSNMTAFMGQSRFIYILGGFNEDNNNILKLHLGSMTYQEVYPMNANRSKFGAIFADNKLFMFGGKRGKQRLNDIETFDLDQNIWVKLGTMSKSRSGFGIGIVEDEIYLVGGNDGQNILDTVQTFSIKTKEWKRQPSMLEARDQLAIAVGNDKKIYAIGGFGGLENEPLRTVQCFDIKTKQWRFVGKMKYARRALSAAVLVDGIYAIGGFDGGSYMSSVEKYDEASNQWKQASSMNIARCTHSSIAIYETQQIYVFGGFDYLPLNSVQKYSLITNEWEKIHDMPSARFMHSSTLSRSNF